jgi:phosphoglycolate phosphatase-like HAD superfamily hydrolase
LTSDFKSGGFASGHVRRTELLKIAIRRAGTQFKLDDIKQICQIGDAPPDRKAACKAGLTPIGVTTGIFSAAKLESAAGVYQVVGDLIFF